jgi:hypothetical protein
MATLEVFSAPVPSKASAQTPAPHSTAAPPHDQVAVPSHALGWGAVCPVHAAL